jgi:hypothetical protein
VAMKNPVETMSKKKTAFGTKSFMVCQVTPQWTNIVAEFQAIDLQKEN